MPQWVFGRGNEGWLVVRCVVPQPAYSDSPPKRTQPFGRFSFSKRIALRFLASCSILSNDNT